MYRDPGSDDTRKVTVRLPVALADRLDLLRTSKGLRSYSEALFYALELGLDAVANGSDDADRLIGPISHIEDMVVALLAIQNAVHDLNPDEVTAIKDEIWAIYHRKRGGGCMQRRSPA